MPRPLSVKPIALPMRDHCVTVTTPTGPKQYKRRDDRQKINIERERYRTTSFYH